MGTDKLSFSFYPTHVNNIQEYCSRPVTDFGCRFLDTKPNFGQYWHFCGTIIDVTTDSNPFKGVTHTSSDKDKVCILDYITKYIIFQEILAPQNAQICF